MKDLYRIKEEVKEFVLDTSYVSDNNVNDETLIFEQGIMDSMGFISIIGFIEDKFSVSPSTEELIEENFESINAITNFIQRKLQA
jgi:acyl carrier protein